MNSTKWPITMTEAAHKTGTAMSDLPLPPLPDYPLDAEDIAILQAYAREAVRAAVERDREGRCNLKLGHTFPHRFDGQYVGPYQDTSSQVKAEKGLEPVAIRYTLQFSTRVGYEFTSDIHQTTPFFREPVLAKELLYLHPPLQPTEPTAQTSVSPTPANSAARPETE